MATSKNSLLHIRRLVNPTEAELAGVLRVMRLAFCTDPIISLVLAHDLSKERLDALHKGFVTPALAEGEGEVWVAEREVVVGASHGETRREREIVGQVAWYLPGNHIGEDDEHWRELVRLLGKEQGDWFLQHFIPLLDKGWDPILPNKGNKLEDAYHVLILSVLPGFQNRGLFAALTLPVISRALAEGRRVLGEATSAENMSKYAHMGAKNLAVEVVERTWEDGRVESTNLFPFEIVPEAIRGNPYWSRGVKFAKL